MKKVITTTALFCMIFTGCATTVTLKPEHPVDSSYAFNTPGNFVMAVEGLDLGLGSTRYIFQNQDAFLYYYEDARGTQYVCDNLEGNTRCATNPSTSLSEEKREADISKTTQIVRRLLGRKRDLTDNIQVSSLGQNFTFNLKKDIETIAPLNSYFSENEEVMTEGCYRAKNKEDLESETFCYYGDMMPFYEYANTSVVPVSLTLSLAHFEEKAVSKDTLASLRSAIVSEISN